MVSFVKETYFTAFVIFFRLISWGWTPRTLAGVGTCAAASAATMAVIECWVFFGILGWISIYSQTKLPDVPKWVLFTSCMLVYAANYYPLVFLRHGVAFEREFSHFKKSKRILLLTGSTMMILAAIAFFALSIFAYRHFFHIPSKS